MGNMMEPDLPKPEPAYEPKFDPMLGFPNGRKERTVKTTKEEMESAAIPPHLRDYCIDDYMQFLKCRQDRFPFVYKCKHELHNYHNCEFEDFVLRMKEYEREARLNKLVESKQGA
ncbi:NADH dehydrogenase [ubiquinone] 1 beta subcomplex subunit 7-like [Argiope bruennichi]|uniref:NADH dehydrogenase [ubiquinone] 1 beta subcomplex subunit 7 n=1 Tax=Argiope bruennichi TaxID=94029 RepID=A0A8T0EQM5_ARGBR|nr:NADH dehydrogenase [ubiquinone] 1 beta subcomplex subunit 7-like [Argiope bruennichi]KAF8778090.1 NADH dehydrogenase 1 beta like protein [Argiope bruennichi]